MDAHVPLNHATLQIFPNENRYEAFVSFNNMEEKVAAGLLEQLMLHLPEIKDICLNRSDTNFKLQLPKNLIGAEWFTKSTVTRFLNIVGSSDLLNAAQSIGDEMSQLEEAINFHLTLYAQRHTDHLTTEKTDGCSANDIAPIIKANTNIMSSDASKNELLCAMESRLAALRSELAKVIDLAAGANCSSEEIACLEYFSQHFGATDLKNCFSKFLQSQKHQPFSLISEGKDTKANNSRNDDSTQTDGTNPPLHGKSSVPKTHDSPPAKVKRQPLSESDDSSEAGDEKNQTTPERSRSLARSASPRRSASPMRRIQIGRIGSHRAPALSIKSLNMLPARERTLHHKDEVAGRSGEEESSGQANKKPEINVCRLSVQDAINLFESKQRDSKDEPHKSRSSTDASFGAEKTVLRRWSAGMGESSNLLPPSSVPERSFPMIPEKVADGKAQENIQPIGEADLTSEKHNDTDLAHGQKEEEVNRSQNQSGELPDQYKEKRVPEHQEENVQKRVEKDACFRATQQLLEKKKPDMISKNVKDVSKKNLALKPPQRLDKKKETSKPSFVKKAPAKSSTPPATRKSWPSAAERSSPKTTLGFCSAGAAPTQRKSQPKSLSQPGQNTEKTCKQHNAKKILNSNQKSIKCPNQNQNQNQNQTVTKGGKMKKTRASTISKDNSGLVPAKPNSSNKATRKSTVVPLESKLSQSKSSGINPRANTNVSSPSEVPPKDCNDTLNVEENEVLVHTPELVTKLQEAEIAPETQTETHQNGQVTESYDQVASPDGKGGTHIIQADAESVISPCVWLEPEECPDPPIPQGEITSQPLPPLDRDPVVSLNPRVRHSLSQMLLEESGESDFGWENAESNPAVIYQRDAPKGLKRLLKFGRKSRGDTEGEDDDGNDDEGKTVVRLRKASLRSKGDLQQKTIPRSNVSKSNDGCSSHDSQLCQISAASRAAKAPRSFFSLSAFRSSKPNS